MALFQFGKPVKGHSVTRETKDLRHDMEEELGTNRRLVFKFGFAQSIGTTYGFPMLVGESSDLLYTPVGLRVSGSLITAVCETAPNGGTCVVKLEKAAWSSNGTSLSWTDITSTAPITFNNGKACNASGAIDATATIPAGSLLRVTVVSNAGSASGAQVFVVADPVPVG